MDEIDGYEGMIEIRNIYYAITPLPILEQLEFAKTLIVGHEGGDIGSMPSDPQLVLAGEVLERVLRVLRANARVVSKLKGPKL